MAKGKGTSRSGGFGGKSPAAKATTQKAPAPVKATGMSIAPGQGKVTPAPVKATGMSIAPGQGKGIITTINKDTFKYKPLLGQTKKATATLPYSSKPGGGGIQTPASTANGTPPKRSMFEPIALTKNAFNVPNFSNPVASGQSYQGVSQRPQQVNLAVEGTRQLSPRDIKAVEAKIVAAGKNAGTMSERLRAQLAAVGIDTSFIKQDYSKEASKIMENAKMLAQNKIKGQMSDSETAKLLAAASTGGTNAKKKTETQAKADLAAKTGKRAVKTGDLSTSAKAVIPTTDASIVPTTGGISTDQAVVGATAPTAPLTGAAANAMAGSSIGALLGISNTGGTPSTGATAPVKADTAAPAAGATTPDAGATIAVNPKELTTDQYANLLSKAGALGKTEEEVKAAMAEAGYTLKGEAPITDGANKPVDTIQAPNGKEYDIVKSVDGKYGFVNAKGQYQYFDSYSAAKGYIDINNPIGQGDPTKLSKNVLAPKGETADTSSLKKDIAPFLANIKAEANKKQQAAQEEADAEHARILAQYEENKAAGNETGASKDLILAQSLQSVTDLFTGVNSEMSNLEEKSRQLFDMGAARSSNARAMAMANKGYLTSDQVAQVANYSMGDYRRDVDIKRVEVEKQISEKKIELMQVKAKMEDEIRNNQMLNEDAKLAQLNYINNTFGTIMNNFASREDSIRQYYDGQSSAIDNMAAQQYIGAESIIVQDDATNIVQQKNKARAMTDDTARVNYIMSRVGDQNLTRFVTKIIGGLIKKGTFMRSGNIEGQASDIIAGANALYQQDLKALK